MQDTFSEIVLARGPNIAAGEEITLNMLDRIGFIEETIMSFLSDIEKTFTKLRRKRVSGAIFDKYGGVIQRGPFEGLKLTGHANISRGPLALKLFGLYEGVVIEEIIKRQPFEDFVNIGAADGYFSLGLLKAGFAKRAICFEMSQEGRMSIIENAELNELSEYILVLGAADSKLGQRLSEANYNPANSLVICDIEGAEFSILTEQTFEYFMGATIIVELHDKILHNNTEARDRLIEYLPDGYSFSVLKSKPVDWSGITAIENLSDNDRALAMSEGRKLIGEWLIASPLD